MRNCVNAMLHLEVGSAFVISQATMAKYFGHILAAAFFALGICLVQLPAEVAVITHLAQLRAQLG